MMTTEIHSRYYDVVDMTRKTACIVIRTDAASKTSVCVDDQLHATTARDFRFPLSRRSHDIGTSEHRSCSSPEMRLNHLCTRPPAYNPLT